MLFIGIYNFILALNYCSISALILFFLRGIVNQWKLFLSEGKNKYNICIHMRKYEINTVIEIILDQFYEDQLDI